MTPTGLPHSEIPGSVPARGSPRRFVAGDVLLRLPVPRHPPCALSYLTTQSASESQRSTLILGELHTES